jgi:hypothetical protein
MTVRRAHLVGSMPFADEETCMIRALDVLGAHLRLLPDGEIGARSERFPRGNRTAWVVYALEQLADDTDGWTTVTPAKRGADGMAVDYDSFQKLRPRRSPTGTAARTSLGYDVEAARTYPIFSALRDGQALPELRFQVGLPTGFAMGFAFASKVQWLRYTGAFNEVLAREAEAIVRMAGDDVVLQIEVPPELFAAYKLPTPAVGLALRPLIDLLQRIETPARIGVHLCLGDFHNEAIVHPKALDKMVAFTSGMIERWPARHTLDFVHVPLAEGDVPPRTDPEWYQPLGRIVLPADTRFVAGFVHEALSLDDNRRVLDAVEAARRAVVDVSSSCGLGRRTEATATQLLEWTARLCDD